MALPILFRYYEYDMPTNKVLVYYNEHLKGESNLDGYLPAISISNRLDEYVTLTMEEQYKAMLYHEMESINKLALWSERGKLRIKTKYACARIIQILRTIEWHQKRIRDKIAPIYNKYRSRSEFNWNAFSYMELDSISRSDFLKDDFESMRAEISSIHSSLEGLKRMKLEDDFVMNVLPEVTHRVSMYYSTFGLDFRSDAEKIGEKAEGCAGELIGSIILLAIIALLAMIFAR